jgi:hypothetical protein
MDDITSFSHRKLSTILKNPDHPHHAAAKAERDRRAMQKESKDEFEPHMMYDPKTGKGYMAKKPADHVRMNKMGYSHDKPKTEGAMKRIATTQSNKTDRMASGGKKGLETFKKREMQKETKGAPKGYHFTRDGKLKKGDAGADGDGGAKLRSDPLDKQRSKIPPLPEKFANPAQQAAVMAKLKKSGKYDAKEGLYASNQTKRLMSPLHKARLDKEKADRDKDGKLMNVKSKPKMEGTVKSFSEISINELDKKTLGSYIKKAGPDAVKQTAQAKRHSDAGDMANKDRDMYKAYGKSQRAMDKAKNRQKGISKAVDKLTKEATIPDGQTAMTKRPELTNNDKDKLARIRNMLDREKKK